MEINAAIQIVAFCLFSLIAVLGALGMATTMSMFRSGIFLMASFVGVAGLFILLLADLLALLQVMMYVGGMLVMILFMVLFSHDPGGEMMTSMMQLPPLEKFFSLGLAHQQQGENGAAGNGSDGRHEDKHESHGQGGGGGHVGPHGGGHDGGGHGGMDMDMEQMSMTTPIKKQAAVLGALVGVLLLSMILLRPAWPAVGALPDQDSPARIGHLLMGKYMIAFEGAGMMILLGIFGAVFLACAREHPDFSGRERLRAAVAKDPAPTVVEPLEPVYSLSANPSSEGDGS